MAELMGSIKGLQMDRVSIAYQVGGGTEPRKASGELVIRSWR